MQKIFLVLLLAAWLPHGVTAQTQSLSAKWTADQKVVLETLPLADQNIVLDVPMRWSKKMTELKPACDKMSDSISTWKLSEDGSNFIISLHYSANPKWMLKDWEMYINRIMGVYLPQP